jgi:hypothetical protein
VLKIPSVAAAAGALLAILAISCAPARKPAQSAVASTGGIESAALQVPNGSANSDGKSSDGVLAQSPGDTQFSPLGIDYAPETRCSDNDPQWLSGERPRACDPQLGESACGADNGLAACPARCEKCYDDDLAFIQRELKVNAVTIYAPNYYILKAARRHGMKVVVGLYNDSVLGLATPTNQSNCSYGGVALYLCGSDYASALIEGGCIDTAGGDPFAPCANRCAIRSDPARDCVKHDCSCETDAQCKGSGNECLAGSYIDPLNNPATGEFLRDGTVIAIQLGNEFFDQCQIPEIPGQNQPCCAHAKATGECRAWTVNRQVYSTAAQTLRRALNRRGLSRVKISVALVERQGVDFCRDGKPPPGIDYIAAHPYCDFVADVPPNWTKATGAECWQQVRDEEFAVDAKACGASHTYIGEAGYNSGCPLMTDGSSKLNAERDFIAAMLNDEPECNGKTNAAPMPNFLFEFGDTCPPGGCISGCGDPQQCNPKCCCRHQCGDGAVCAPNCPSCLGNGYFGVYRTPGYATIGFPPEPKFNPPPSLMCPGPGK